MAAIQSSSGASFALLTRIGTGQFDYGVSTPLALEYEAKLFDPLILARTALTEAQVRAIFAAIAHFADPVPIFFRPRPNLKDEGENLVFECAAHFGAEFIVTHNVRDFLRVEIKGYTIKPITPGEFLRQLNNSSKGH
jgi:predicted nucleic acid-binding protein